ncbi:MAG: HDOD domain-containing protein [Planctomycetes bacterium]|nr:HDOD domain-containing protein [Planctomycetota bacterium]
MLKQPDERIGRIFKTLVDVPSLPAAVQKLLKLSDKDSSPREFADIVATDQGLTAKVLRLVNSAFYSLRTPISSLRHASSLLGTKTLKSMALSVSVMNLFNKSCAGFDPFLFWKHSIAVAVGCQRLAARFLPAQEEDLYVVGLLHDAGVVLLAQHLAADYPYVLKLAAEGRRLTEVEEQAFGISHAELGCTLATRWRLPGLVCECIRHHETADGGRGALDPAVARAVDLVRLADEWAVHAGLDFLGPRREAAPPAPEAPAWTGLDAPGLASLLEGLAGEVAERERWYAPQVEPAPA